MNKYDKIIIGSLKILFFIDYPSLPRLLFSPTLVRRGFAESDNEWLTGGAVTELWVSYDVLNLKSLMSHIGKRLEANELVFMDGCRVMQFDLGTYYLTLSKKGQQIRLTLWIRSGSDSLRIQLELNPNIDVEFELFNNRAIELFHNMDDPLMVLPLAIEFFNPYLTSGQNVQTNIGKGKIWYTGKEVPELAQFTDETSRTRLYIIPLKVFSGFIGQFISRIIADKSTKLCPLSITLLKPLAILAS